MNLNFSFSFSAICCTFLLSHCNWLLVEVRIPLTCGAGTTHSSYFLLYIVYIPTHDIDDHMETNDRKDRLNRLRLRSDDRDDSYDRDDHMETRLKA